MKTLSLTPRPYDRWKAETLSFLYVLLVWGVKLASLLNKRLQSWQFTRSHLYPTFRVPTHKEIYVKYVKVILPHLTFKPVRAYPGTNFLKMGCSVK